MPSTRLRQKTVVLARNFYNLASIIGNVMTPRMLNPSAWASLALSLIDIDQLAN
jgi:SP family general alpha glucoside:H+ symporter-like MFS transporter